MSQRIDPEKKLDAARDMLISEHRIAIEEKRKLPRAAGTSAIFTSNPLERSFRDVHVATQHRFASPEEIFQVGAVLLGVGELPW